MTPVSLHCALCEKPAATRGWCRKHYMRWLRTGSPHVVRPHRTPTGEAHPQWKGNNVGYFAAHERVVRRRGRARDQVCQCGNPADAWSYNHNDPNERRRPNAGPYSGDPAFYDALCLDCHTLRDRGVRIK